MYITKIHVHNFLYFCKELTVANALSRAPESNPISADARFIKDIEANVNLVSLQWKSSCSIFKRPRQRTLFVPSCINIVRGMAK